MVLYMRFEKTDLRQLGSKTRKHPTEAQNVTIFL